MENINLREINENNFNQVIKLYDGLTDYQKKCVAPNVYSLAEAYANKDRAWVRAIYLIDKPIGFIMMALWDDDIPKEDLPAYYLWRFMISREYQNKGFGKKVLDIIIKKCQTDRIKTLYVSCEMEEKQPFEFYIKYGFIDTRINDGEQILKMTFY